MVWEGRKYLRPWRKLAGGGYWRKRSAPKPTVLLRRPPRRRWRWPPGAGSNWLKSWSIAWRERSVSRKFCRPRPDCIATKPPLFPQSREKNHFDHQNRPPIINNSMKINVLGGRDPAPSGKV